MSPEVAPAAPAAPLRADLAALAAGLRARLAAVVLVGDGDDRLVAYAASAQTSGTAARAILAGSTAGLAAELGDRRLARGGPDLLLATGRLDAAQTLVLELTMAAVPLGSVWIVAPADAGAARRVLLEAAAGLTAALEQLGAGALDDDAELASWWQLLHVASATPAAVPDAPPCQVLAWRAPGRRGVARLVAACRATAERRYAGIAAHSGQPVVYAVARPPVSAAAARALAGELAAAAGVADLRAGLGPAVGSYAQLPWARACADDALSLAGRRGPGSVCVFEEEFADLVLEKVRTALGEVRLPAGNPLAALRDYDRRRATSLAATLQVYLSCDGDTAAAAARLGVHPNTLRYRLARAEHVLGLSTADRRDRLALELLLDCHPAPALA